MSHSSSPQKPPPVNVQPDAGRDRDIAVSRDDHRQMVRQVLGAEKRLRTDGRAARSSKPDQADEVLRALCLAYPKGERLSTDQIAAAAKCGLDVAVLVRTWARAAGVWRYRPPDRRDFSEVDRTWEGGDGP